MTWREQGEASLSREPVCRLNPAGCLEFLDAAGVYWRVTERDARHDPGARSHRCLIFASAEAVRRVWDYPPGWRDLPTEALIALSWQR